LVPTETCGLVSSVASEFAGIVVDGFGLVWFVLTFLATWVWYGIKILTTWTPIPTFILPWWGYLIILGIIGWIVSKCTVYVEEKNINTLREENPAELYAKYRAMWLDAMVRLVLLSKVWKNGEFFQHHFDQHTANALMNYSRKVIRKTFEKMWSAELDELQKQYPFLNGGIWELIVKDRDMYERFMTYKSGLTNGSELFPTMDTHRFINIFVEMVAKDIDVKNLAEQYRVKDEEQHAKKVARKNSWGHVTCLKFTTGISDTVHSVGRGFKTLGSNTMTFTAYMWMLIKAKKQGACPYFKFAEPTLPSAPIVPTVPPQPKTVTTPSSLVVPNNNPVAPIPKSKAKKKRSTVKKSIKKSGKSLNK